MGLKQSSQPIFSLPEYFTNFRAEQSLNCLQLLHFFKNLSPYPGVQKPHFAFDDALIFPHF